jgi:hypothetical protein
MRKNVNDWVSIVLGGLLTCCLLLSMSMFVQAACSGDNYCGKTTGNLGAPCSSGFVQAYEGKLACYKEGAPGPGGSLNCAKNSSEAGVDCSTCSCKSKPNPSAPVVDDPCSCQ